MFLLFRSCDWYQFVLHGTNYCHDTARILKYTMTGNEFCNTVHKIIEFDANIKKLHGTYNSVPHYWTNRRRNNSDGVQYIDDSNDDDDDDDDDSENWIHHLGMKRC